MKAVGGSKQHVEKIEQVTADCGEKIPLQPSDIIISTLDRVLVSSTSPSREFCQIVRLYANGTVLARVLGTDAPRLLKVSSIMVNLSFVGAKEQAYTELRRSREKWEPGKQVSVFSRGLDWWCPGYISQCIDLRSDARIAHGDLWFQVVYLDSQNSKLRYKQVKFDNQTLEDASRLKECKHWEQFHELLLKENQNRLSSQLIKRLENPVQSRSPSPQSSESTTSMGEDKSSDNGMKKERTKNAPEGIPTARDGTPLFHRQSSIDEFPGEIGDKPPSEADRNKLTVGRLKCGDVRVKPKREEIGIVILP